MLEAAVPDAADGKPAQPNTKDAPAAQTQGAASGDPAAAIAVLSVDLALLMPELPVEVCASDLACVTNENSEGESLGSAEAAPADQANQADDPASVAPDAKAAEIPVIAIAPPPPQPAAPASVPMAAASDPDSVTAAASNALPAAAVTRTPPAEVSAQVAAATAQPQPSAEVEAVPARPDASQAIPADKTPATAITAPNERPVAAATIPFLAEQAKPSARTEAPKEEGKTTKVSSIETAPGKEQSDPQVAAKPAQPHPSDTPRSAGDRVEQDLKPAAHQPHAQPSEHTSATARVAAAAAHSDLAAPTSVAQAVTTHVAATPPLFGLNAAMPLASPLQTLWQPAARTDSTDNTVPISGLAVEIVSRVHEGLRRFEIRLDPPELGRIDVRLEVDRGGNVTSRLTVERAETLDLLRRDAPQLERALQHAGLNTEGGLQFSLRDQNFANREQTDQNAATFIVPEDEPAAAEAALRGYGRLIGLGGGVDIRV